MAWYEGRFTLGIAIGIVFGMIARFQMLRTDYRQYPTYPHGKIIHIALGFIAAGLGAVAVPALLNKEYTAVTFLTLAAQQFRDVRKMERETLMKIDETELVPRGSAYIEGIAMVFEGRNYLVILTALVTTLCTVLFAWYWGVTAGVLALLLNAMLKSGKNLKSIVDVQPAEIRIDGPGLYVDNIYIMNIGLEDTRNKMRKHGMGFILTPSNKDGRISIANLGQRQAILHNLSAILGIYRDSGEPSLLPMAKLDLEDGRLAVFFLAPQVHLEQALQILQHVPLLEYAVRLPRKAERKGRSG
ncbi:YIEGIA family protein [Paenibacillus sp. CC-CFT747]|nr:YIEGIA family protein [Paenibacillus sp. CC-CFT747]